MLEFIQSGSFRRVLAGVAASLSLLLSRKFGLEVDPVTIVSVASIAIVYIAGGNVKEAALAKAAEAAAKPSTIEEDAAVLGGKVEERK